jgi:hypothetical protein
VTTKKKEHPLYKLLEKAEARLSEMAQPTKNYAAILLTAYLIRSRLNHQAICCLTQNEFFSECSALIHFQIEMRLRTMVFLSEYQDYALSLLRWHEELKSRLTYLGLEHLANESAHMEFLISQTDKEEGKKLIRQWFSQKPQPQDDQQEWLRNWHLWHLDRLVYEVQKHLIESPRQRKEIDNLLEFLRDHNPGTLLSGMKRYALIDEEFDAVTFCRQGEERWPEGPVALVTAAICDMVFDISEKYGLNLAEEIEIYRAQMNASQFQGL